MKNDRKTSKQVASTASKILRNDNSSTASKEVAGSALSQKAPLNNKTKKNPKAK